MVLGKDWAPPSAWGDDLTQPQRQTLKLQELFLTGYSEWGTIKAGLIASGVNRRTAARWLSEDKHGFKGRLAAAYASHCDMLEGKAVELAMGLKPGQNALILITLLNANLPNKYRPNAVVVDDSARETLEALRALGKAVQPKALTEGEGEG